MYAIAFDMDTAAMQENYPNSAWQNGYTDIRNILREHGFEWQQGSVLFGNETVDAVKCVLAIIDVTRRLSWFAGSVRDVRMLRIEERNDLMPAIREAGEGPNLYNQPNR
jgi:virulence-associated protein VapD